MDQKARIVFILVGTPGIGKTTLSKNLMKDDRKGKYTLGHYTSDGYKNMDEYIGAIILAKEDVLILDRCNEKVNNRKQLIELFSVGEPDATILCIDFINKNNKRKIKRIVQNRIKDRDPEGQSLIYQPENNGYVVFKIVTKKLEDYVTPRLSEGFSMIINVDIDQPSEDLFQNITRVIDSLREA